MSTVHNINENDKYYSNIPQVFLEFSQYFSRKTGSQDTLIYLTLEYERFLAKKNHRKMFAKVNMNLTRHCLDTSQEIWEPFTMFRLVSANNHPKIYTKNKKNLETLYKINGVL